MIVQAAQNKPTAAYIFSLIGGILGFLTWFLLPLFGSLFGIIIIFSALMLDSNPLKHTTWGLIILTFSIFGLALGSWIFIIALMGGILALIYKPTVQPPPPPVQAPPVQAATSTPIQKEVIRKETTTLPPPKPKQLLL
jgi:hypothetical protein